MRERSSVGGRCGREPETGPDRGWTLVEGHPFQTSCRSRVTPRIWCTGSCRGPKGPTLAGRIEQRPGWRNGRRGGLKIRCPQGCVGSSPTPGTPPCCRRGRRPRRTSCSWLRVRWRTATRSRYYEIAGFGGGVPCPLALCRRRCCRLICCVGPAVVGDVGECVVRRYEGPRQRRRCYDQRRDADQ